MIGFMGNNVFPLRMGEVLRAVVLKRRADVAISGSLATIVVEKIFDAVVVIGFVLLNLGQLARLPGGMALTQISGLAAWSAVIFLVGLALFVAIAMFPSLPSACCTGSSPKSSRNAGATRYTTSSTNSLMD